MLTYRFVLTYKVKKLKYISIEKQKRKKFILGSALGCMTAGFVIALPIYFLAKENKSNSTKINQTNFKREKNIFSEKMLSLIPFRNDQLHNKERYIDIFNNKDKYLGLIEEAKNKKELNEIFNEWKSQIDGYKKSTLNFVSTNSEIEGGNNGTIFQAKNGDIYAMGKGSGIKVLKNNEKEFKSINSDITNGEHGTIFQAKNGDIYAMANGSQLQVLKKEDNIFRDAPGSTIGVADGEGNKKSSGEGGVIFQAKNGDIYAMSHNSALEVLKNAENEFTKANGSNIVNGERGIIFQAKNEDIYTIGNGQKLQILKKNETNFQDAKSEQEITGGATDFTNSGIMFESTNGDIYACGGIQGKLQILRNGEKAFKLLSEQKTIGYLEDPTSTIHIPTILYAKSGDIYLTDVAPAGLYILEKNDHHFKNIESKILGAPISMTKHSGDAMLNITTNGSIFQARNGDIFVSGPSSELQFLENGSKEFHQSFKSNIKKGAGMKIFQASNGDIYTMGKGAKLQVRKYGYEVFVDVNTAEPIQGTNGTIFQAKNGDIYAMGENSKLQVLKW